MKCPPVLRFFGVPRTVVLLLFAVSACCLASSVIGARPQREPRAAPAAESHAILSSGNPSQQLDNQDIAVPLWNMTDSLLEKLALGQYTVVPPSGTGLQGVLTGALEAAVAEERARRAATATALDLGWHWPWSRKKRGDGGDSRPSHKSNPNMTFDLDIALESLALTSLAYCEPSLVVAGNCSRCKEVPGLTPRAAIHDSSWNLQGYSGWLESSVTGEKEMVVGFRGTDAHSIYNWAENLRATKTDFQLPYPDAEGARVHSGFFRSYNNSALREAMLMSVLEMMDEHPGAPLHVVGHSLGGAMASICALEMRLVLGVEDVRITTFGSPRVGNDKFHNLFDNVLQRSRRFTHNNDIVPSVPTMFMGFQHVATELFVLDVKFDKLLPSLQLVIIVTGRERTQTATPSSAATASAPPWTPTSTIFT
eukprot:CAMPEP_0117674544 /NCGR_PEP_ID=MMETSP0804-20121206/15100_1 /TAXON_ID=1074897 /ORGANISM="Tetraselmis astigmatica, Strain CCMP880" /LENGTH=422 /DNA_ID=CAMNT_0005483431 /DNA_START=67 /DNA_END=1336 /DNA_ORIENTATION=+